MKKHNTLKYGWMGLARSLFALILSVLVLFVSCNQGNNKGNSQKNKENQNNNGGNTPQPDPKPTPNPDLAQLHIKKFTICEVPAGDGTATVDTKITKIEKGNVTLIFLEKDADVPQDFEFVCEPETMPNPEDKVTVKISTKATKKYASWNRNVVVTRGKAADPNTPKNIDDCVAALKKMLSWTGTTVSQNIQLPLEVEGFAGSTVVWQSKDRDHCSDTGEITSDLKDVEVTLEATVHWDQKEKKITFTVTVSRIKTLTHKFPEAGKTVVYVYDFSDEHALAYKKDDISQKKFEIKNIDTTKKEIEVRLLQVLTKGVLTNIENIEPEEYVMIERFFGVAYRKLMALSTISWQDFKEYLKSTDPASSEEYLFEMFREVAEYGGDLEAFKNLQPQEMTDIVKNGLHKHKKNMCKILNVDENTPDENLETALKKAAEKRNMQSVTFRKEEKTFKYTLEKTSQVQEYPEGIIFRTIAKHNDKKNWNEQIGDYKYHQDKKYISLSAQLPNQDGTYSAYLYYNEDGATPKQYNFQLEVKADNSFAGVVQGGESLNGSLQDSKNGKLKLTTTSGAFTGEYELEFHGKPITLY